MALSYTYTEVPWEDRLIVACNGIKVTKESHIFGDDEYTRTPEFYISDNKLWDEFYFHIYKNCEVDLRRVEIWYQLNWFLDSIV